MTEQNGLEVSLSKEDLEHFLLLASCKGISLSGKKDKAENVTLIDGIVVESIPGLNKIRSSAASLNKLVYSEIIVEAVVHQEGKITINPVASILGGKTCDGAEHPAVITRLHKGDVTISQNKSMIRFKQPNLAIEVPRSVNDDLKTIRMAKNFQEKADFDAHSFMVFVDTTGGQQVTELRKLRYRVKLTPKLKTFLQEHAKDVHFLKGDSYSLMFDMHEEKIWSVNKKQVKISRDESIDVDYIGPVNEEDNLPQKFTVIANDGIDNLLNNIPLRGDESLDMYIDPESRVMLIVGELSMPKAQVRYGITFSEIMTH